MSAEHPRPDYIFTDNNGAMYHLLPGEYTFLGEDSSFDEETEVGTYTDLLEVRGHYFLVRRHLYPEVARPPPQGTPLRRPPCFSSSGVPLATVGEIEM